MKKTANRFLIICFCAFLAGALLITAAQKESTYSYYENRSLAGRPVLSVSTVLNGSFFDDIETYLVDHAAGRTALLFADTFVDMHLLHRPVVNDVVVTKDALLAYKDYTNVNPETVAANAEQTADEIAQLRDQVEAYGGSYCYVAVPCQYASLEDTYPTYLYNKAAYTDASLPVFSQALTARGISIIDMGAVFESLGVTEQYASTIDNHYSLHGAYETYRTIVNHLNATTQHSLPFPREDEIVFTALPNPYLGAYARKVFNLWNSNEQLYIAEFTEDIPFTRYDNGSEVTASVYQLPASTQEDLLYSLYMGGDKAETVIDTDRPELPSVLIYGDSFTNALECLFYYSCDELRAIDKRHYAEMSVSAYIEMYRPDIVLCVRDYEAILYAAGNGILFS